MPAIENGKASNIIPFFVVKPTGPFNLEDQFKGLYEANPDRLLLLPHTATSQDVSQAILRAVEGVGPKANVDLIISALGGTGAGKGITLMGQGNIEKSGVSHDLFHARHSPKVKSQGTIRVLEIIQNKAVALIDVKDLGRNGAQTKVLKKADPACFIEVLRQSKVCSIDGLRTVEGHRVVDNAEHGRSSRSTVIMTSHTVLSSGRGSYRTTIIDPPGIEDPRVVPTAKPHSVDASGIAINKAYFDALAFIESTLKGGFLAKGRPTQFTPICGLHTTGNPVVLCILAVLYGNRSTMDPDPSVLTVQRAMDSRDGELILFLKKLLGAPAFEINKLSSKMHRQVAAKPVVPKQVTRKQKVDREGGIKAGTLDAQSGLLVLSIGEENGTNPALLQQFLNKIDRPSSPGLVVFPEYSID
ncbi:hypothetical protein M407DRAFT_28284 [Tulasnella calospora MUT 4182]|uniref:Uncharacterized protein n=1 Tax=Tulasnella calospora MUT 4182 TaxID=1051891 RepID=A0A0C3KLC8_9AGAM|nr:hypothetical protein M407DRAFT_28284 [Tulasnella calospora MUT 4182]